MAKIKLAYIGGGSTRAPGTMAAFIKQAANFKGSHFVLVDINAVQLAVVHELAVKMAKEAGADFTITATTDRRQALAGCDVVLTSFRPGGFEARYIDESIPLKHGVLGQETQGPGGFFMALRSIHAIKSIVKDMEELCPDAVLVNYTNPINIVSQAVTQHSKLKTISLCEGPIVFPRWFAEVIGLDPDKLESTMIGLNHGSWSIRHRYDGEDFMPLLQKAYERMRKDGSVPQSTLRLIRLAVTMGSLPAHYYQYYYFNDEIVSELRARLPRTRSRDILEAVPSYWQHYREQSKTTDVSVLDPALSRGGILELELAVDVIDAIVNDRRELWPVNVPNNGAIAGFPDDLVVEVPALVDKNGATPTVCGPLPMHLQGLVQQLACYQQATAEAGWSGRRIDAIRALASHPLVPGLDVAERLYDEMAGLLQPHLPARLWALPAHRTKKRAARAKNRSSAKNSGMQLIVAGDYAALSEEAAKRIASVVDRKPEAALVVATGNTPMGSYQQLLALKQKGQFDPRSLTIFQLDEYFGLPADDPRTLWGWMERSLITPLQISSHQVVRLRGDTVDVAATCLAYDRAVVKAGGFDLCILGLGGNGHIGFNEPPAPATAATRLVDLSAESLASNSAYWDGKEVPAQAITAGMSQLLAAKQILLLVSGKQKSEILQRVICGPVTASVPASFLQLHPNVIVLADQDACAQLPSALTAVSPVSAGG